MTTPGMGWLIDELNAQPLAVALVVDIGWQNAQPIYG
jgi:hypothetical protein